MGWLQIAGVLLKVIDLIAGYLKDRQLINAGKAEAIVEGLQQLTAMVDDAAKGAAGMTFDTDWSRKVRDKYRRP
jgi:hypothetical protein